MLFVPFYSSYFNGKEKDWESGFHYYGARYYWSEVLTGWLSVDPMLDKYPNVSPYNYCMWNPVKLVDPDGKDIWIIDGNESIKYTAGMSSAGFTGFSEQAITALNEIHQTDEGKLMLDFLVDADISVSISFDYNTHNDLDQVRYDPDAYFNVETNMPGTGLGFICDISWNSIESGGQQCVNGIDRNTTLDLADEIAHAYDAGNGWAYRYIEKKGKVVVDEGMVNGYDKREFQAAYRVNIIREQMGNKNYRTKYYSNLPIADKETFYKPCWYTLRSTDKTQRFTFDIP